MKTYQLWWGVYVQWTKQFASDEEAISAALATLKENTGWKLYRWEVVKES